MATVNQIVYVGMDHLELTFLSGLILALLISVLIDRFLHRNDGGPPRA